MELYKAFHIDDFVNEFDETIFRLVALVFFTPLSDIHLRSMELTNVIMRIKSTRWQYLRLRQNIN